MSLKDKNSQKQGKNKDKRTFEKDPNTTEALTQAEEDIKKDPDFQPDPQVDLDEGELARLEGEK